MAVRDPNDVERTIHGDGVGLRVPSTADRGRWLELFHDPEELRFGLPAFVPVPDSIDALGTRVAAARSQFQGLQPGTLVVVEPQDPHHFLGTIGWSFHVPSPLRVADIGYAVHPDARRRGIARRAISAFTRWLTTDPDGPMLARVQLDHSVENLSSCRVASAAGFEQEGIRRAYLPLRDPDAKNGERRHDVCLHGFIPGPGGC